MFSDALPTGTLLAGTYVVEGVLGQGGFGITYRCHDRMLDRRVAIKEFFPSGCRRQDALVQPSRGLSTANFSEARAQFLAEARLLARCHHPGIVGVYTAFEANETAYMVMELLHGPSLAQLLEARGGRLGEEEAVPLIERCGEALQFVHDLGLLHRDIKPENIIVCDDGRVMLIDFGTAREYVKGQTQGHTIVVTPGYAPLEQYARQAQRGAFTDVYGLAATLYHLLTGNQPPAASDRAMGVLLRPVREENPQISRGVARAVEAGLQMEIAKRPQSVREFLELLHAPAIDPPTEIYLSPDGNAVFWKEESDESEAPAPVPFVAIPTAVQARQQMLEEMRQPVQLAPQPLLPMMTPSSAAPASSQNTGGGIVTKNVPAPDSASKYFWSAAAVIFSFAGLLWLGGLTSTNRSATPPTYSPPPFPSSSYRTSVPSISPSRVSRPVENAAPREMGLTSVIFPSSVQTLPSSVKTPTRSDGTVPSVLSRSWAEFSPDGKRLAYLDSDAVVRVWSVPERRVVHSLPQSKTEPPITLVFSPDGEKVVMQYADSQDYEKLSYKVGAWNLRTGKSIGRLSGDPEKEWLWPQAVLSNGQVLILKGSSGSVNGRIPSNSLFLWNPRTGKQSAAPIRQDGEVTRAALSTDGKQIITGDDRGIIRWFDARTGKQKVARDARLSPRDYPALPSRQNIPSSHPRSEALRVNDLR
ncbi:MAG: protein kinase, partial [Armatimonadetes bacterium]|nr:protein kinase [Armatimonadota bacterium]